MTNISWLQYLYSYENYSKIPDSKVHGAMNLAIRDMMPLSLDLFVIGIYVSKTDFQQTYDVMSYNI